MHSVVITGIGAVSPLGLTFEDSWRALCSGVSGIGRITRFDASGLPSGLAGELKGFDPRLVLPERASRRFDPFIQYALAAADAAAGDAGVAFSGEGDRERSGVCLGTARGGIATIEDNVRRLVEGRRASAYSMPASTPFMAAAAIAMHTGVRGPSLGISTACSSGAHAICVAASRVRSGELDLVFAGGAEAPITPVAVAGYGEARALSRRNDDPAGACRPFCRERDGFVLGEGAAVLVLESLEHARSRGARIIAEILGTGTSTDAYDETRPDPDGAYRAILAAFVDAQCSPDDIGAVSAHGTGTPLGDRSEAEALGRIFGTRLGELPLFAVKAMTGHLLGASGALEVGFAGRALKEGVVPPARNFSPIDEALGVGGLSHELRRIRLESVLCNSFGFGGGNAAIVLRRVE